MRIPASIYFLVVVLLTFPARAQQSVPDAPQAQKKPAAKAPEPAPEPAPDPPPPDSNAVPEDVSRKAADSAGQTKQPENNGDNPFPEDESKAAAKAAGNDVSTSQAKPAPPVHDPVRSAKDEEVGTFYLKKGDYQAALQRYQDAAASDATNVSAIFGLAEAQHMLKKNADAIRNYQLYLDIVPNGPKAKQALKALKDIERGK